MVSSGSRRNSDWKRTELHLYSRSSCKGFKLNWEEYKGLDVQMDSVEVADEEVEAKLKEAQEQNAREITNEDKGAVQDGDIITLQRLCRYC